LCLIVGENYRDFPTLRGVIELVSYRRPQTKFVFVTLPRSSERIGCHPNLNLLSGIPESELLNLYQSAALMVMPFTEATANNSILESMACGLPLVVTDIGDIRCYVTPEAARLIPPYDSIGMAKAVLDLLEQPEERQRMAVKAREQSLNFSWPKVIDQLDSVYDAIA
jgi:glycosyltransferase involved in cell wall biosynthesis